MDYADYIALRQQAELEGWHHWCRIAASRDRIPAVEVHHCIPFSDPYDLDAPTKVLHPSPRCVAELMAGGIHPPIEAIHAQRLLITFSSQMVEPLPDSQKDGSAGLTYNNILPIIPNEAIDLGGGIYGIECTRLEAPAVRSRGRVLSETVIDNSAAHLTVAMPMTYEQAIGWIIQKDIPFEIWGKKHNRPMMAIVPRTAIPKDRTHRNDWKLKDLAA